MTTKIYLLPQINSQFLASYPLTTTSRHSNSLPAPPWPERFFSTTRTSKIFPPNLPTLSASQVAFCALPDSDSMAHRAHHLPAYLLSSFASFPPSTRIKSNSPHLASAAGWLEREARLIHNCADHSFLPVMTKPKQPCYIFWVTLLFHSLRPLLYFFSFSQTSSTHPPSTLTRWLTRFLFH